jgi:hypothetical protein
VVEATLDYYLSGRLTTTFDEPQHRPRKIAGNYEYKVTDSDETIPNLRDVFYAIERFVVGNLPLQMRQVGTDETGWTTWNPWTYQIYSSNESQHMSDGWVRD